jgi:hypothetical protein
MHDTEIPIALGKRASEPGQNARKHAGQRQNQHRAEKTQPRNHSSTRHRHADRAHHTFGQPSRPRAARKSPIKAAPRRKKNRKKRQRQAAGDADNASRDQPPFEKFCTTCLHGSAIEPISIS